MGNAQPSEDPSFCGFNLLSSNDLRRSSLHKPNFQRSKTRCQTTLALVTPTSHQISDLTPSKRDDKSPGFFKRRNPATGTKRHHTYHLPIKEEKEKQLTEQDFRIVQILSNRDYGKICLAKLEDQDDIFLMKILTKKRISNQTFDETFLIEKEILEKAQNFFIPKLLYVFENDKKIFLVKEHFDGGELNKMLRQLTRLSEEITRFYSAEVLLALEYLHDELDIVYNDLKPENVFLDREGHIRLVNFDLVQKIGSQTTLASTRHMLDSPAPEVIKGNISGTMIDFWEFGCFIYELLSGKKPYKGPDDSIEQVEKHVLANDLEWPSFISKNARDLIERLVDPRVEERLGHNGIQEIKNHQFFSTINWTKLAHKAVYPPLDPSEYKQHIHSINDEELLGVDIEDPEQPSFELIDNNDDDLDYDFKPKRRLNFLNIPNSALLKSQQLFSRSPTDHSLARSS